MAVTKTIAKALAALALLALPGAVFAEDENGGRRSFEEFVEDANEFSELQPRSDGVLAQLGYALKLPDQFQLRDPKKAEAPKTPFVYDRMFPIWGQQALNRGFALPEPYGISYIGVVNTASQQIENVAVNIDKGVVPPPNAPLIEIGGVATFTDIVSRTNGHQLKADVWVLPFINVFAALGKNSGFVTFDLNVDLDALFPFPICSPLRPCGTATTRLRARTETTSGTVGFSGVYGFDNYFLVGTMAATRTIGGNSVNPVEANTAGLRFGRRYEIGNGNLFAAFVGVSYLNTTQTINSVARLRDAFSDGDDLNVRYRARLSNPFPYSFVVGFNYGHKDGWSFAAEYNRNAGGDRFVGSVSMRF
ncbi:autotransporter outer membrane beta-barrel domain-containing protein [Shimia biformata]|uniref:autotransporter outer membrane beta-barrel domain-containing protein n=1 Tax=Shimia biformata TaxID=1294299 RepID=UPI00194DCB42|nr:autotransporter outer membrane beta-barrel domain-containing protein [Shimia biformata]